VTTSKQHPLLGKNLGTNNMMAAGRERLNKHILMATDTHASVEVLLEMVCSVVVRAKEL
jgi:hypothetical protein